MYLTKHVFKSFSIEISVGILYFVFQYSFVGIVFTVNQSIYETTKFLFELWSLQSFIIMKCWKIINDSTAPFKSSNRLQKNTPTASFLHSSSLPRSSLWRATLVPSCNKKKSSFFFCLRRYFLKRLSVSSSVLFSFLQFLTFSHHLLSIFLFTCLLDVRKLMRWRNAYHTMNEIFSYFICIFLSECVECFYVSLLSSAMLSLHVIWMRPWSNTSCLCLMLLCLSLSPTCRKID